MLCCEQVGVGGKLHYIFPSNGGLNPADTLKAKALGIDAQMAADIRTSTIAATWPATEPYCTRSSCASNAPVQALRRYLGL